MSRPLGLLLPAAIALWAFAACPTFDSPDLSDDDDAWNPVDDDDDATDDDDDATDDDDDVVDPGPAYPEDEQWFALAVGNRWRYTETVDAGGGEPVVDDVIVQIVSRRVGSSLDERWGEDMAAFEILIDRALGTNATHWLGLDGTDAMKWLRTVVHDPFGDVVTDGDGEVVFKRAAVATDLVGETYDTGWYLTDVDGLNFSAVTATEGSHQLPNGQFIDALENDLLEGGETVGVQRVRGFVGLLGFEVSLGGGGIEWDVVECSVCPKVWQLGR